jgi:hypothetical protein
VTTAMRILQDLDIDLDTLSDVEPPVAVVSEDC